MAGGRLGPEVQVFEESTDTLTDSEWDTHDSSVRAQVELEL